MKKHIITITFRGISRQAMIEKDLNEDGKLVLSFDELEGIARKLFPTMLRGQTYTYG